MKRVKRPRARAATAVRGVAMHALLLVTLVAFALSGYLTQTHIHITGPGAAADIFDGVPAKGGDKTPSKNDPANCPLCQQAASSGHFVTPAAAAVLLPSLSVSIIAVVTVATATPHTVSHTWLGRGPPQA